MASDEIYELVIRMRPEGAEETQETLEETQETFEETADTADEESTKLDRFSRRWKGAMTVIAASLAVVTSALLANMPIVSDLMDGLRAIIETTALVIDDELRPALEPLVNDMFALAEAIGDRDGEGALAALDSLQESLGDLQGFVAEATVDIIFEIPDIASALADRFTLDNFLAGFQRSILNIPGARLAAALARRLFGMFPQEARDQIDQARDTVSDALDGITSRILTFHDTLNAKWDAGWAYARGRLASFVDRAVSMFGDWRDDLRVIVGEAISNVEARFERFRKWVAGKIPEFGDTFGQLGETIKTRFLGPLEQAYSRAVQILASLQSKADRAIELVGNITGIDFGSIGESIQDAFRGIARGRFSVPGLQSGGRVTGTGMALIHAGEEIVPEATVERTPDPSRAGGNRFAERQEMVVRFEPSRFRQFVSAELEDSPANVGRGAGPR